MNPEVPLNEFEKVEQFFESIVEDWQAWALGLGIVAAGVIAALVVHAVIFWLLARGIRQSASPTGLTVLRRIRRPALFFLPLIAIQLLLPQLSLPEGALKFCRQVNGILLILSLIWLLSGSIVFAEYKFLARYKVDVRDNRMARRMHTQFRIIRRTLIFVLLVTGGAAILMTFPMIRQFGVSLLASAGIAGLIVGLAAKPAIENLIAGIQLAITQPITLDDVVVIQGEWGRIEEITATYIVVRIWDQRRLIVPFTWILQQPFTNWTRTTSDILGTVFIHADYTVPVQAVREELQRIAEASDKWDSRVCGLQVTDSKADTLELRALVSASDSPSAWDLRCEVREKLVAFLQREHPDCLPRVRAEIRDKQVQAV